MRPVRISLISTGASSPVVLDYNANPFQVGLFLDFASAPANAQVTVQYSFDDPWASYATDYNTDATWYAHPNMTGKTSNTDGNIAFPVRAVRANTVSISGTNSVAFTVIQSSQS